MCLTADRRHPVLDLPAQRAVKASFGDQLDIMKNKHTWFCVVTYVIPSARFPLSAAFRS